VAPRLPTLHEDDPATPSDAREFLLGVERSQGEIYNSVRVLANLPRDAAAFVQLVGSLRRENGLTPTESELAWTTSAVINACHY
jgi:alkylhydroperoxidase family enzyme